MKEEEEKMTPQRAAEWLAQRQVTRNAAAWQQWLANNRNPNRPAAFRVPCLKDAGRVWYALRDLVALLATEQAIQAGHTAQEVTLLRAVEEGMLNRPWPGAGRVYAQYDSAAKEPFVKLAIDHPLITFRLSLKEAAALLVEVDDAIVHAENMAEELDATYRRKTRPR